MERNYALKHGAGMYVNPYMTIVKIVMLNYCSWRQLLRICDSYILLVEDDCHKCVTKVDEACDIPT